MPGGYSGRQCELLDRQRVRLKVFTPGKFRFLKQEHLDKTHDFYLKYGGKTIIIARFIPIIRTLAPFVAGIGTMPYRAFLAYNIIGATLWVGIFVYAGFYFAASSHTKEFQTGHRCDHYFVDHSGCN